MIESQGREGDPENHDTISIIRITPHSIQDTMLRIVAECIAGPSRLPLRPFVARSCNRQVTPQRRNLSTTSPASSGHNRWSKIRHKKGAVDAQRSAIFSRLTNVRLGISLKLLSLGGRRRSQEREDDLRRAKTISGERRRYLEEKRITEEEAD